MVSPVGAFNVNVVDAGKVTPRTVPDQSLEETKVTDLVPADTLPVATAAVAAGVLDVPPDKLTGHADAPAAP